ncbi:MAG: aspartate aminotransferase family protein [bacterium]
MKTSAAHGLSNPFVKDDWNPLLKNYSRYLVEFVKGEGAYLYDSNGREYLDFLSGIAVTGFGHNHAAIKSAVEKQLNELWHVSNLFESTGQINLAQKIASASGLDSVFFCNSGTEANEAAIKFARKWGNGKSQIITALGSFHGRTLGSMSATGQYKIWEGFFPLTPGFCYVPFGDIEAIENSFNSNTVAIMLEPIQGESGIVIPPEGYLKQVREFCDKHSLLLILDEVQTGAGRTGKTFAYQHDDILPDIVTLAKGIANGIPLGAVACTKEVGDTMVPGTHGSTFGGNPLAVAAANSVFDLLDDETLQHINKTGEELSNSIKFIGSNKIKEVRGKGLLIGVEFSEGIDAKKIAGKLLNQCVVTGTSGNSVIRLLPPYIINQKEINKFIEIFVDVIETM